MNGFEGAEAPLDLGGFEGAAPTTSVGETSSLPSGTSTASFTPAAAAPSTPSVAVSGGLGLFSSFGVPQQQTAGALAFSGIDIEALLNRARFGRGVDPRDLIRHGSFFGGAQIRPGPIHPSQAARMLGLRPAPTTRLGAFATLGASGFRGLRVRVA